MNRRAISLATLLLLSACASDPVVAPSLLPRAAESQSFDEPAPAPVAAVAPDPALDQQIGVLIAARTAATRAFDQADQRVAAQLASGAKAAVGSDAWLDAQTAIGALDAERAAVLDTMTDLVQLAIARAERGEPTYPALEAVKAETEAEVARVSAITAKRKAALPL